MEINLVQAEVQSSRYQQKCKQCCDLRRNQYPMYVHGEETCSIPQASSEVSDDAGRVIAWLILGVTL
eukprot:scaffold120725_cov47-Attheya_sp.AAC.1